MADSFRTSFWLPTATPLNPVNVLIFVVLLMLLSLSVCHCVSAEEVQATAGSSTADANWSSEQRLLYDGIPVRVHFTPANPKLAETVMSSRYYKTEWPLLRIE